MSVIGKTLDIDAGGGPTVRPHSDTAITTREGRNEVGKSVDVTRVLVSSTVLQRGRREMKVPTPVYPVMDIITAPLRVSSKHGGKCNNVRSATRIRTLRGGQDIGQQSGRGIPFVTWLQSRRGDGYWITGMNTRRRRCARASRGSSRRTSGRLVCPEEGAGASTVTGAGTACNTEAGERAGQGREALAD
eukprot:565908-Amphidinium_carterae.2